MWAGWSGRQGQPHLAEDEASTHLCMLDPVVGNGCHQILKLGLLVIAA